MMVGKKKFKLAVKKETNAMDKEMKQHTKLGIRAIFYYFLTYYLIWILLLAAAIIIDIFVQYRKIKFY